MKRKSTLLTVLLVVLVAAAIVVTLRANRTNTTTRPIAVIKVIAQGFVPATVVITPGTRVTWVNVDQAPHKIASNPYPENTDLPGLKSGDIGPLETYSYVADSKGTFGYHEEDTPTVNGTLVVK